MIIVLKLLLGVLGSIDPLIFLAPICLALSACFVALMVELEKVTARWRATTRTRDRKS